MAGFVDSAALSGLAAVVGKLLPCLSSPADGDEVCKEVKRDLQICQNALKRVATKNRKVSQAIPDAIKEVVDKLHEQKDTPIPRSEGDQGALLYDQIPKGSLIERYETGFKATSAGNRAFNIGMGVVAMPLLFMGAFPLAHQAQIEYAWKEAYDAMVIVKDKLRGIMLMIAADATFKD